MTPKKHKCDNSWNSAGRQGKPEKARAKVDKELADKARARVVNAWGDKAFGGVDKVRVVNLWVARAMALVGVA